MSLALALLLQNADIDRWIADLGAEDAAMREAATENLKRAGKDAEPALRKAAESKDLEIAGRAKAILAALEPPPLVKAEREASAPVRERLKGKITLSLKDVEVGEAVVMVSQFGEIPFHVSPSVRRKQVSVEAQDVALEEALGRLLGGLNVTVFHGIVWVRPADAPAALPGPTPAAMSDPKLTAGQTASMQDLDRGLTYSFRNADARSVLEIISKETGSLIEFDAELRGLTTLETADLPAHVVLRMVCADVDADWSVDEEGVVRVKKRD